MAKNTKTKVEEQKPEVKGEVDIHSPNAIDNFNELLGTPVDSVTIPEERVLADSPKPTINLPAPGTIRILVAIPILEVTFKFFETFLKFWSQMVDHVKLYDDTNKLIGNRYEIGYHLIHRKSLHIADTIAVQVAQRNGCTHLLLVDDDVYDLEAWMVDTLLAANKDVIGGVMYTSGFPYTQCTFRRYNTETTVSSQPLQRGIYRLYDIPCLCPYCMKNGQVTNFNGNWNLKYCPVCRGELKDFAIQPVDLIPFPFTLINMSVFDRIRKPWFHCNSYFPTDSWFADRCIEAGIQQYAHMNIRVNHRGVNDLTRIHKYNEQMAVEQTKRNMIIVTPEEMERHEKLMMEKMYTAESNYIKSQSNNPTFTTQIGGVK